MTSSVRDPALLDQDPVPLAHHSVQEPVLLVREPGFASVEATRMEAGRGEELELAPPGNLVQAWAGLTTVLGLPAWAPHQAPPHVAMP